VPLAAGIDVGGTKMLGVVIDTESPGDVLRQHRVATARGTDAVVTGLVEVARALGLDEGTTLGLGIPGLVDDNDVLRMGPNLPDVVDAPIGRLVASALGLGHVPVDNDATCAALAEFRGGAGIGVDDGILVALGTGIGAGIISGGRIMHGVHGFAGEPGHMLVDPNGPMCPCGRRGCWERFASGSGLGRLAREWAEAGRLGAVVAAAGGDPDDVKGEHVTEAARAGDRESGEVLDRFAWWIAVGLANLVNILDPHTIVLGGGVIGAADLIVDRVVAQLDGLVLGSGRRPTVPVVAASMGEHAGAVGAALLGAHLD
jgi:glucokinase